MGVVHVSHAGIIDAEYSNGDSIQLVNDLTLQTRRSAAKSALARQAKSANNSLEIVVSVVLDLDPSAFFSMVNGHVCRKMLL